MVQEVVENTNNMRLLDLKGHETKKQISLEESESSKHRNPKIESVTFCFAIVVPVNQRFRRNPRSLIHP